MEKPNLLPDSPSFVDLCTLHQHAMRYYRLWIYACNIVLAIATLVFTVFAVSVLVDPRITLLSGVELYQPTFVYAYVALIFQCGVLQTIGCLGALRLNQRLLNTYWTLLFLLMVGDIVVGLVWAIRLDRIKSSLRPTLRQRLTSHYRVDPEFTQVWDWVQTHEICCGIDSPDDFHFNESIGQIYEGNVSPDVTTTSSVLPPLHRLPSTCCTFTKRDSMSPSEHSRLGSDELYSGDDLPMTSNYVTRNNLYPNGRDYRSSEINKRYRNSYSQSFHPTKHRSPRETSSFLVSKELKPSVTAAFARNRLKILSNINSTTINNNVPKDKTEKMYLPNQSSKVGRARQRLHPPPTPPPPSSSETNPVMMMRAEGVQSICELPSELMSLSTIRNPQESSTTPPSSFDRNPTTTNSNFPSSTFTSFTSTTSSSSSQSTSTTEIPKDRASSSQNNYYAPHLNLQFHILQHRQGCAEKILAWVDHVTDVLFVIGFCIIVFLKGCFLAILRYEIKEMIQKIRLLNGDETLRSAAMNELIGLTSMYNVVGSQEDLAGEEVTCESVEVDPTPPVIPPDTMTKNFPLHHHHHHHRHNACGGGTVVTNNISEGTGDVKPKKGYPPYGNYLNSNNMMYRLQRQVSQQQQNEKDDIEDDSDSCSALLQMGQRRRQSSGGGEEKRNSLSGRVNTTVAIPIPRNGNNNSMALTTTALVNSTSITGGIPLTSAAATTGALS